MDYLEIKSPSDFPKLDREFLTLLRLFPMFAHDISKVRANVDKHRTNCSRHLVDYRRTKRDGYLIEAQHEIDAINTLMKTISQYKLMAILYK